MTARMVVGRGVVRVAVAMMAVTLQSAIALQAQTPAVLRFDGGRYDRAGAMAMDASGNVYVAGSVEVGSPTPAFAAVKLDRNGGLVWRTNYGGSAGGSLGQGNAIAVDGAGNVYVAGYVSVGFFSTQTDALVLKFDANGVEQWARRYNGPGDGPDGFSRIAVDATGQVYVTGQSYGTGVDWVTHKFAPDGTLVWTRRQSGAGAFDDFAVDVALDLSGNLIVTGTTRNRGDSITNDITTLKYSPAGAVLWTTTYSGTALSDDLVLDMAIDAGGDIYLSGAIAPTADPEGPVHVPLVLRYDGGGTLLRAVQETATGNGMALALDGLGDVYVATESTLYKYDSGLDGIRAVALIGNLYGARMRIDSQGNILIGATVFDPFTFVRDYYSVKLTSTGQTVWSHRFNGTGNRDDVVADAVVDSADAFWVTGTSWGNYVSSGGAADDIVTLKFSAGGGPPPAPEPPAAPGSLTAAAQSRAQIRLAWSDNSTNETHFSIERCTGAGCTSFTTVAQVGAGVTTFADGGLARRTTYRYRVRALNSAGSSGYSNIASSTTR
jgi:hypothetical protein